MAGYRMHVVGSDENRAGAKNQKCLTFSVAGAEEQGMTWQARSDRAARAGWAGGWGGGGPEVPGIGGRRCSAGWAWRRRFVGRSGSAGPARPAGDIDRRSATGGAEVGPRPRLSIFPARGCRGVGTGLLARPRFCRAVDRRTYALSAQPQRGLPPSTQLLRGRRRRRRGGSLRGMRLLPSRNRVRPGHWVQG